MTNTLSLFHEVRSLLSSSEFLATRGGIDSEAEELIQTAFVQRLPRLELFNGYTQITEQEAHGVLDRAKRRLEGDLLQHLTGRQAFRNHEYEVGPDVLVPRPETEQLVEEVFVRLKREAGLKGLEIGIGSGVISTELLSEIPELSMVATEVSPVAFRRAKSNARRILGYWRAEKRLDLRLVAGPTRIYEVLDEREQFDFLVSNPPYLTGKDPVEAEVKAHEPGVALFAPESDAVYFYRAFADRADLFLKPGGFIACEIPSERSDEIQKLFRSRWKVEIVRDLAGRERVLIGTLRGTKNG